jgi:fructose-1,6-bisphosphatase/inositol monophosphatase family enzyme
MGDSHRVLSLLNKAADAVKSTIETMSADARRKRASGHPDQFKLDLAADRAARRVLERGDVEILSEESGRHGRRRNVVVVIDPVDGSVNCSRGAGFYGPSLCAVDDAGPIASVVLNLSTGRRYTAVRGTGARANGRRLKPSRPDGIALIATGDPCPYLERFPSGDAPPIYTRLSGASAHDLCLVADGTYDGYVDCVNTQSLWDYLAASLVLVEAGGALVERNGVDLADIDNPGPRRLIAAGSSRQLEELAGWVQSTHSAGAPSH